MLERGRGSPRRCAIALLLVGCLLGPLIGCSSGSGGGTLSSSGGLSGLLRRVPDTTATRRSIVYLDWSAASDLAKTKRPPADANYAATRRYVQKVVLDQPRSPVGYPPDFPDVAQAQVGDIRPELGFSWGDLAQSLSPGPPAVGATVMRGRFDKAAIAHAAHTAKPWNRQLHVGSIDGATVYRWGSDNRSNVSHISPARPLGQGGRLALSDDMAMWAVSDRVLDASLDAGAGKRPSLADNSAVSAVAESFDEHHGYNAVLTAAPGDFGLKGAARGNRSTPAQLRQLRRRIGPLPAWRAALGGCAASGGREVDLLVLDYADHGTAERGAKAVASVLRHGTSLRANAPLAAEFTADSVEVRDEVVTITGRAAYPRVAEQWLIDRDLPVLHG